MVRGYNRCNVMREQGELCLHVLEESHELLGCGVDNVGRGRELVAFGRVGEFYFERSGGAIVIGDGGGGGGCWRFVGHGEGGH